jgi:signal recognition particle subunit SEC65
MAKVVENPVADQVVKVASNLGYEATIELDRPPFRVFGWFRGREFKHDVLVKNRNKSAIVVARSSPVIMYDVFLTNQIWCKLGKEVVGALICVPDSAFPRIRGSSRDYAKDLSVRLCPLSEVGDALKELLD